MWKPTGQRTRQLETCFPFYDGMEIKFHIGLVKTEESQDFENCRGLLHAEHDQVWVPVSLNGLKVYTFYNELQQGAPWIFLFRGGSLYRLLKFEGKDSPRVFESSSETAARMTDTLKSICEQCTHLSNPQLDFTPPDSPRRREILARDLQELIAAAATEREKSVVLLAGSVLEGILHSLIQSHQDYIAERRGTFNFNPTGDLQTYVNIFNRWLSDLTSA